MDPIQQAGIGKAGGITPASKSANPSQATQGASPSFHALLEKLEQQAGSLQTRDVPDANNLAGAVDEARESLRGALELGQDLLEAYRKAQSDEGKAA
jgi:hypothetical protein